MRVHCDTTLDESIALQAGLQGYSPELSSENVPRVNAATEGKGILRVFSWDKFVGRVV